MSNITRVSIAVEIGEQVYFVALPQERLRMLMKLAEGLSDSGKLPVKRAPESFKFSVITEQPQ